MCYLLRICMTSYVRIIRPDPFVFCPLEGQCDLVLFLQPPATVPHIPQLFMHVAHSGGIEFVMNHLTYTCIEYGIVLT